MNSKVHHMNLAPAVLLARHRAPRGASSIPSMLVGTLSALGLATSPALAQTSQAQPAATQSTVPVLIYRSAFTRYKPFADQSVLSWREVNDEVGRIGGWRVYAREAQQPAAIEPAANDSTGRPGSKP